MHPAAEHIGSVGGIGAYLAQTTSIGQLTDAVSNIEMFIERFGVFVLVVLLVLLVLLFVTRATGRRSDADATVQRITAEMTASLAQQNNRTVEQNNRTVERFIAIVEQVQSQRAKDAEMSDKQIDALTKLTEAINQSNIDEALGRDQAVNAVKVAFVEVHEETMSGFEGVTEKLSEIEKSLSAAGERLLQVADKDDVKAIGEMIRNLTTQVEEVKTDVGKLKNEKEAQHEEVHPTPDPVPAAPASVGSGAGVDAGDRSVDADPASRNAADGQPGNDTDSGKPDANTSADSDHPLS